MTTTFFLKTICTIVFLCLFSSLCFSQKVYSNEESSRFSFTAGMTSSDLVKNSVNYSRAILCGGGFMYGISLSPKFNLTTNLLYTGKAIKTDNPSIKYRYFYVDLPLYLQYKISDNIRINAGGQYSWFTNSKTIVIDGSNPNGINALKAGSIKDTDYGFLIGGEIGLSENISFAARYCISASTFFEKNKINFDVFQLSFNYDVYRSHRKFFHKKETIDK